MVFRKCSLMKPSSGERLYTCVITDCLQTKMHSSSFSLLYQVLRNYIMPFETNSQENGKQERVVEKIDKMCFWNHCIIS